MATDAVNTIQQPEFLKALAMSGAYAAVAIASLGSSIGAGLGGSAAIGAWKKRYIQGKSAPFLLMVLAGAPLSQTIYALVLMMVIRMNLAKAEVLASGSPIFYMALGVIAGLGFMMSAIYQGRAAAAACDAYGETEKGFTNYLMILGVVETVAIFVLVFGLMVL